MRLLGIVLAVVMIGSGTPASARLRDCATERVVGRVGDAAGTPPSVLVGVEEAMLEASDGAPLDGFGGSAALSRDGALAIVSCGGDDTSTAFNGGSARLFARSGSTWSEAAVLLEPAGAADDGFGGSVAMSADGARVLVGVGGDDARAANAGGARVYVRGATGWSLEAALYASDAGTDDGLGRALAMSADGLTLVLGVPNDDTSAGANAGSARVFSRTGTLWVETAALLSPSPAAGQLFGSAVAIDETGVRMIVAAARDASLGTPVGRARVYARSGTTWALEATLAAAGADGGVALSRDASRALVGSPDELFGSTRSGTARVFARTGTTWALEAALAPPAPGALDEFGSSVALSDDGAVALVGAHLDDVGPLFDTGSARLFRRSGTAWSPEGLLVAAGAAQNDYAGGAGLAGDGSRAALGIGADTTAAGFRAGSARIFALEESRPNGAACTVGAHCTSSFCVDGVCCASACGGGAAADCQACSAALTGGADGACAALSAAAAPTIVCRASALGPCDAPEICVAGSTACPSDALSDATTVCRAPISPCDLPELCTGASAACPADLAAASGTTCRAAAGACDVGEVCDGTSHSCPGDVVSPAGVACRSVMGLCDFAESCDGTSPGCPLDARAGAGLVCRPAASECDAAETCTGVDPDCPPDVFAPSSTVCGPAPVGECDAPDHCAGASADCVATFLVATECRPAAGACDRAETCSGDRASCPPDALEPAGLSCRSASDPRCDTEEVCDGTSAACPADETTCTRDAGAGDGGAPDAGGEADAATTPVATTGCGCSVPGPRPAPWMCCLLVLAALARRQRSALALAGLLSLGCTRAAPASSEPAPTVLRAGGAELSPSPSGTALSIGGHDARIELRGLGRGGAAIELAPATARAAVHTLVAERAPGVTEWWARLDDGLEHGVTISSAPAGEGRLWLDVAIDGLSTRPLRDDAVELVVRERAVGRYAGLVVIDATGARLPARMLATGAGVRIEVDDTGARYPLIVDPLVFADEAATLRPSGGAMVDGAGTSVATDGSGTRVVIGVPFEATAVGVTGSARVFVRTGTSWAEEATLLPPGAAVGDQVGTSVALSADGVRAVVGAPGDDDVAGGTARVWARSGTLWALEATLGHPSPLATHAFGIAVGISSDGARVIVGAQGTGTAHVFSRSSTTWSLEASLAHAGSTRFGAAVALGDDGLRAIVGAPFTASLAGSAFVFARSGTLWAEEATLLPSGPAAGEQFGAATALSAGGLRAIVGVPRDVRPTGTIGSARIFARSGTLWTEEAALAPAGGAGNDEAGRGVALSGDGARAIVGSPYRTTGLFTEGGHGAVFVRTGTTWTDAASLLPADLGVNDHLGFAAAIAGDGTLAFLGAPGDRPASGGGFGSVRVFSITPSRSRGAACARDAQCLSGACVDGVCCESSCGGGSAADCLGCSAALTGMADGTCAALSASTAPSVTCRVSAGVCDPAEVCIAGSMLCPTDTLASATTECRASASGCDAPETCTGASPDCPTNAPRAPGVECRPAAGACDVAESCDGASFACPGDTLVAGVTCRAPAGVCDVEETCSGTSALCPGDVLRIGGPPCRDATAECDVAESCDGSAADCPANGFAAEGTACGPAPTDVCDAPDRCAGTSANCLPTFLADVECRPSGGPCDRAESCVGDVATCPDDERVAAGISCRTSSDPSCDPEETCDGTATSCPADVTSCTAPRDAGRADAGRTPDAAGVTDAGPPPTATTGCGCTTARVGRDDAIVGLLLTLGVILRRARVHGGRA